MKRIQRKNFFDYSWRSNPNAVYIGRPSKWGNPFKLSEYSLEKCLEMYKTWLDYRLLGEPDFLKPLIGKDLVCFCPLDKPCHADILIEKVKEIYGEQ